MASRPVPAVPRGACLLALAWLLALAGPAAFASDDDEELYKTRNCFACHRVDRNHLGPAFRNIAAKYAQDEAAPARLAQKIREGSTGVWGPTPMPPQPQVSEAEAQRLARWILAQK